MAIESETQKGQLDYQIWQLKEEFIFWKRIWRILRYNTEEERNEKYKKLRCVKDGVRFNKCLIKIQEGDNRENGGRQYSKK